MDMSDSLSSEWDIVNSSSIGGSENDSTEEHVVTEPPTDEKTKVVDMDAQQDSEEHTGTMTPKKEWDKVYDALPGTRVHEMSQELDSNSSSDIDIIDEIIDDCSSNLSIHPMEYSLSSSFESNQLPVVQEVETVNDPPVVNDFSYFSRLLRNHQLKEYLAIFIISCVLAASLHNAHSPKPSVEQMQEHVSTLQAENEDLKNRVLSKIEDDKLFVTLEEQVKALKNENLKLSVSMQALIMQLEEQTAIFKKENEVREKDPYKNEIDRLKEQVNILQIDNDELQKQLVRMRYGIYSPHSREQKEARQENDGTESKVEVNQNDDMVENSSDVLSEEIKELRKKLFAEVEKLKDWKDSVQHLVKKFGNPNEAAVPENEKPHENKESNADEDKPKKAKKKDKKFYDWTWKDVKKNFKGTLDNLPNINVPDMFQYMNVDKKKVEGAFETVGHYFKKAQEKTKKIFHYNGKDMKSDVWQFFGELRKKWDDVKDEFFERNYGKGRFTERRDEQKSAFSSKPKSSEADKKYKYNPSLSTEDKQKHTILDEETNNQKHALPVEKANKQKHFSDESNNQKDSGGERNQKHAHWDVETTIENEGEDANSWMFERAAYRSELRDEEIEDTGTNWFLRKKKSQEEDEALRHAEKN